jgi:hypothetical protein
MSGLTVEETVSHKHWLAAYGQRIPAEINPDAVRLGVGDARGRHETLRAKTGVSSVRLFVAKAKDATLTEADVIAHCRRAVGDRAAERTFARCPLDIDMDPLPIPGAYGKPIDAVLVNRDPFRYAHVAAGALRRRSETVGGHRHLVRA